EQFAEPVIQAQITISNLPFAVDAALIDLDPKAEASNNIEDIGAISGTRDLIQEWGLTSPLPTNAATPDVLQLKPERQIKVHKFGRTTKLTHGTIMRLRQQRIKLVSGDTDGWVMEVEPLPSETPFEAEYKLDMPRFAALPLPITTTTEVVDLFKNTQVPATSGGSASTPTLKIVGRLFSRGGDSGSPLVDDARQVIGIVRSGTIQRIFVKAERDPVEITVGHSQGVFIRAALEKLNVSFLPAGQNTSGAAVRIAPGMPIERTNSNQVDWDEVERVHALAARTETGARLAAIGRRHFAEVRQ